MRINGVNVDHLGGANGRSNNPNINYIECSVDNQMLETLMTTLRKKDSGVTNVELETALRKKDSGATSVECEQGKP